MALLGSLFGGLLGGGGGDVTIDNQSAAASDVSVDVSPVIINTVDLTPLEQFAARLANVQLAGQERTAAAITDASETIRWTVAAGMVLFVIATRKAKK